MNWRRRCKLWLSGYKTEEEMQFKDAFPNYCYRHRERVVWEGACTDCFDDIEEKRLTALVATTTAAKEWKPNVPPQ